MRRLRKRGKDISLLVEPTTLLLRLREDLAQRFPEAQRAVADREDRGAHTAAEAVAQQVGPRLVRLAEPVGQRDELPCVRLRAPRSSPAGTVSPAPTAFTGQPRRPIGSVIHTREIACGEGAGLVLPLRRQPGDR